jgi:TonB family protein
VYLRVLRGYCFPSIPSPLITVAHPKIRPSIGLGEEVQIPICMDAVFHYTVDDMIWRLLVTAMLMAVSLTAEVSIPSQFYIVSVFFSDYGPAFYYRVMDITPDGMDSIVKYSRIADVNLYCPRRIVQIAEARVKNTSPGELVKANNPCAIKPRELSAGLRRYRRFGGRFETVSYGIVAQCGASLRQLALPSIEQLDWDRLKREKPHVAKLWDLASDVVTPVFGADSIFHDRTDSDELALQTAGEKLVPDLISGRYDAGLADAIQGNEETWRSPSFRSLLETYRGPLRSPSEAGGYGVRLEHSEVFPFSNFVTPIYPPLSKMARIQGKVELKLKLDPVSGEVLDAAASGHPLLTPSAIVAARHWRFKPNAISSETVSLTLDYALHCP